MLARPAWRKADTPEFIARACDFTRGLEQLTAAEPDMVTLHDTTAHTPEESARVIAAWVRRRGADVP